MDNGVEDYSIGWMFESWCLAKIHLLQACSPGWCFWEMVEPLRKDPREMSTGNWRCELDDWNNLDKSLKGIVDFNLFLCFWPWSKQFCSSHALLPWCIASPQAPEQQLHDANLHCNTQNPWGPGCCLASKFSNSQHTKKKYDQLLKITIVKTHWH